jgi:hypothetical protein
MEEPGKKFREVNRGRKVLFANTGGEIVNPETHI